MGTYLSTPVTDKCEESGGNSKMKWGVVDMQGWRKSMEDAHIAHTPEDLQVFGVFDGHGGPEVARFCQLYLVSVLQKHYQEDWGLALRQTFHALDRMVDDPARREEIVLLRTEKPPPGEQKPIDEIPSTRAISSTQENTPPPSLEMEKTAEKSEDDDSDKAVGKEEAAELDQNLQDEDGESIEESSDEEEAPERVNSLFQRFLSLSSPAGQLVGSPTGGIVAPVRSASKPSILQNGRWICNLPDHPIHAGATAIVAVIHDGVLTVANAGDSRAVLCRGGETIALSDDHKPTQEEEMNRIRGAGGFVNQFGRVNGNLNLSRSIGDLKYKQVPGIKPEDQMITAEPDIMRLEMKPEDEFLILGCDGIWDCLTNERAVEYVRKRLHTQTPAEIGRDMLDSIISEDPRSTQGIGGDNMTIMIIDLKPETRNTTRTSDEKAKEPIEAEDPSTEKEAEESADNEEKETEDAKE